MPTPTPFLWHRASATVRNSCVTAVKVSVSAIKDSQSHTDHAADEEEEEESDDLASMVIMPPGVKMAPYRLSCFVYQGKDLPQMDTFGWCDGFIKMIYSGAQIQTEVFGNNAAPVQ